MLGSLSEAECSTYPSVGMGTDLRLKGRGIIGAAIWSKLVVLHPQVELYRRCWEAITGEEVLEVFINEAYKILLLLRE